MSVRDTFRGPRYKINRVYWRVLGLWPRDDHKATKRAIVLGALVSLIVPQAIRLRAEWSGDLDVAIEIAASLLYLCGGFVEYLSFLRVEAQMAFIFDKIASDWRSITHADEIRKLEEYGLASRRLTLGYLIPVNVILAIYVSLPLTPAILDIVSPLNDTRPRNRPIHAEYFVDEDYYYYPLTLHGSIVCALSVQIYGSLDTTYALCVQHACALFAIVEIRMQRAVETATSASYSRKWQRELEEYRRAREVIFLHKEAIQFADDLDKSYSLTFFLGVALSTALICLTAVVATTSFENGNLNQATRFAVLYLGHGFRLLYVANRAQQIVDRAANVRSAVYNCQWYELSPRTRRLLGMVMLRSSKKTVELDLESFANVFRKSVSYATVIASIRC